ncbi:MAG: hypothetical protein LUQ11_14910 [Methylococcaceae bacterium]|nr:hypothetical protein [Methylococcaceae bacterium]
MNSSRQPGLFDFDAIGSPSFAALAFRERLNALGLTEVLFERFKDQLALRGFVAKTGQMIDATFV